MAAAVIPFAARAQSQDSQTQSVADAARRAREQKKAAEKQPTPVITNDTLKPAAPADATAPAPAPTQSSSESAAPSAQPAAEGADQKTKDSAEAAGLKQQLAEAQKDVDLLQREYALEQENVYSKSNYATDTAGKAKLEDLKRQIADKQQALDALKARIGDRLGPTGNTPPAAPPAPPQP